MSFNFTETYSNKINHQIFISFTYKKSKIKLSLQSLTYKMCNQLRKELKINVDNKFINVRVKFL